MANACRSTSITTKFDRRGGDLQDYRFASLAHEASADARGPRSLEVLDSAACLHVVLAPCAGHCDATLPQCTAFLDEVLTLLLPTLFLFRMLPFILTPRLCRLFTGSIPVGKVANLLIESTFRPTYGP